MLNCAETAAILRGWEKILVLSHVSPDGDTLGSACGLIRGLRSMGKRAEFRCADPISPKYSYLFRGLDLDESAWQDPSYHVVTVDVADLDLLGSLREAYAGRIELAIDHHGVHRAFTENRWVEGDSAATAELIWLLLKELGVLPDAAIADDIYTGVSTDTGCFRYRNTTPRTLRIAAEAIEAGAAAGDINQKMFETKSLAMVKAELLELSTMEVFCGGKCSMIRVPLSVFEETGAKPEDMDGSVASLARQIEGVLLGVTLKEKEDGSVKASVRANPPANAAAVCQKFGGGGHTGAAGCSFPGLTMEEAAQRMKQACCEYLEELDRTDP